MFSDEDFEEFEEEEEEFDDEDEGGIIYNPRLQDCIRSFLNTEEDKQRSVESLHSDSHMAHLNRINDIILNLLKSISQKRPVLEYHGDLSEGKARFLANAYIGFEGVALEEICLVDSHLSSNDDVDSLVALLKGHPTVRTLKLSGSFCDSIVHFERFLSSICDCPIELLQLGVPFSSTLHCASDFLRNNVSLKDLDINHLTLLEDEVDSVEDIADVLQQNQLLEKFTLFDCTICDEAMNMVGRIVKENRFINYLDLGSLTTSQQGIITLFDAFKENSTIEYFFFDKIREKSLLKYLVNSLKSNNSLHLHKDHGTYGDTLARNPEIREMWMSNTMIVDDRELDAIAFLHVARKLLVLDNLPMELKLNIMYILLAGHFHRLVDKRVIVNGFSQRDSIGKLSLLHGQNHKFSARTLIAQSYLL